MRYINILDVKYAGLKDLDLLIIILIHYRIDLINLMQKSFIFLVFICHVRNKKQNSYTINYLMWFFWIWINSSFC